MSALEWGQETGLLWIGGILAGLVLLHVLASWAERRGWINYRRRGTGGGGPALSNAMAEFEAVLNPAAEYRLEEERSQRIISSATGQGPVGNGDDGETWLEAGPDDSGADSHKGSEPLR